MVGWEVGDVLWTWWNQNSRFSSTGNRYLLSRLSSIWCDASIDLFDKNYC